MHGVEYNRFAQSATTMIGMGADGLEEAGAIHGIMPGDGERGEGLVGAREFCSSDGQRHDLGAPGH